jgi:hypothetical protein
MGSFLTKRIYPDVWSDGFKDASNPDVNVLKPCSKEETKAYVRELKDLCRQQDIAIKLYRLPPHYSLVYHSSGLVLCGHPSGRIFETPAEFLPHLLWLVDDSSHNYSNCTCKHCPSLKYNQPKGYV